MVYTDAHMVRTKQTGFTIVELLIVIVVIGILAAIVIVAFNGVQTRAKVQQANSDLNALTKAIEAARINQNKTLYAITGSACTRCGTQASYENALDRIGAAAGMNLSGLKKGNPWGVNYSIDENEGENGNCNRDGVNYGGGAPSGTTGIITPVIETYAC